MSVVLFGGEKGGTGKTTLATNLAVYLARQGAEVLVLDTDKQGSASGWAAARSQAPELAKVQSVSKFGDVLDAARDLAGKYQHIIIIDAGGRDSRELRSAMLAADVMFVPIKASQFDLWTMERMNELVDQSQGFNRNLKAFAVLSMAPTNPRIGEAEEARTMLSDFEHLILANTIIRERKVYRDAVTEGRGVLECGNEKAVNEIESLGKEVLNGVVQS
jgi:chromosome partitioning protein